MENQKTPKKRGRPPKPPQSLPLFLGTRSPRVERTVPIAAKVSAELEAYLAWASGWAALPKQETLSLLFEHMVSDFIRRDRLYQTERARALDADAPTRS